jgi:hypothetical protein
MDTDLFRGKPVRLLSSEGKRECGYLWETLRDESGKTRYEVRLAKGETRVVTRAEIEQEDKDDISELMTSEAYLRRKEEERMEERESREIGKKKTTMKEEGEDNKEEGKEEQEEAKEEEGKDGKDGKEKKKDKKDKKDKKKDKDGKKDKE